MDDHDLAVGALLDIDLDPVGLVLECLTYRGQRILGRLSSRAAMGDDGKLIGQLDVAEQPDAGRGSDECRRCESGSQSADFGHAAQG